MRRCKPSTRTRKFSVRGCKFALAKVGNSLFP
jgi:hypothetical protein